MRFSGQSQVQHPFEEPSWAFITPPGLVSKRTYRAHTHTPISGISHIHTMRCLLWPTYSFSAHIPTHTLHSLLGSHIFGIYTPGRHSPWLLRLFVGPRPNRTGDRNTTQYRFTGSYHLGDFHTRQIHP